MNLSEQQKELVSGYANVRNAGVGSERYRSRILPIRDVNNWVKAALIDLSLTRVKQGFVLDFCCGKGGDLLKYSRPNVNYYVGIDIVPESILEAVKRYNEKLAKERQKTQRERPLYTADFVLADVFNTQFAQFQKKPSTRYDLVSCMFALHYAFASLQTAEGFFSNVQQLLAPQGSFIAVFPCKENILAGLRRAGYPQELVPAGARFGNELYSITFPDELRNVQSNLFGQSYKFFLDEAVGDITEYLVDTRSLKQLCSQFGLRIEHDFSNLEDFFHSEAAKGGRNFFSRMLSKTARYVYNFERKIESGKALDTDFWQELDQEQETELDAQQVNRIPKFESFQLIPDIFKEVINLYRAVIIKHENPDQIPSVGKFNPHVPQFKCAADVVNLTGKPLDMQSLREHFREDLDWQPYFDTID